MVQLPAAALHSEANDQVKDRDRADALKCTSEQGVKEALNG
jgi:hypothetical protein